MSYLDQANLYLLQVLAKVDVKVNPSLDALPGGTAAEKLVNGIAGFGLLYCTGKFILGAAQWSYGSRHGNFGHADEGKSRMLAGVGGAFAIGAVGAFINFFFGAGTEVR